MNAKESYEFELKQIGQALYKGESKTGLSGADILDDIAGTLESVDIRGLICAESEEELLYNARNCRSNGETRHDALCDKDYCQPRTMSPLVTLPSPSMTHWGRKRVLVEE